MSHNDIGTLCPIFYVMWAYYYQRNRAFLQAKEIIQLGTKRYANSEPSSNTFRLPNPRELQSLYQHLLAQIAQKQAEDEENGVTDQTPSRKPLGALSAISRSSNGQGSAQSSQRPRAPSSSRGTLLSRLCLT